jgi:hypothetical protein
MRSDFSSSRLDFALGRDIERVQNLGSRCGVGTEKSECSTPFTNIELFVPNLFEFNFGGRTQ